MNSFDEKHIGLLNNQIIVSLLFIGTIIVSISLTYDEKQKLSNGKRLYTDKQFKSISLVNRIVILMLGIYYLYDNYEHIKISKLKCKNPSSYRFQEIASILNFIGALLVLYVVIQNYGETSSLSDIENPNL